MEDARGVYVYVVVAQNLAQTMVIKLTSLIDEFVHILGVNQTDVFCISTGQCPIKCRTANAGNMGKNRSSPQKVSMLILWKGRPCLSR